MADKKDKITIALFEDKYGYQASYKDSNGNWHNINLYLTDKNGDVKTTRNGNKYVLLVADDTEALRLAVEDSKEYKRNTGGASHGNVKYNNPSVDPKQIENSDDLPF